MNDPDAESRVPNLQSRCFVLVAGEASGDALGAGLMQALRARYPNARFAGIGGARMIDAGLDSWHPLQALSVMGLVEVLRHLPQLLAIRRDVVRRALALQPDAFIGIDAPDFNLGVEKQLKRAGIRTVHYVSPSIWAWRRGRAARIGRSADCVLCLFPMEPPIYAECGVDARFVGHPFADAMALEPDHDAARAAMALPATARLLALLPGSRIGEIARLSADFLLAARQLADALPDLRVVAPMANADCRAAFERAVAAHWPQAGERLVIIDGHAREAMLAADAVLLASGTATLEAMLAKRPMVVAYRIAPLTHFIVKRLGMLHTDVYALPNILANQRIVPELMQDACTPEALAAKLQPLLESRSAAQQLHAEFRRLHELLRGGGSVAAAAYVADMVARPRGGPL